MSISEDGQSGFESMASKAASFIIEKGRDHIDAAAVMKPIIQNTAKDLQNNLAKHFQQFDNDSVQTNGTENPGQRGYQDGQGALEEIQIHENQTPTSPTDPHDHHMGTNGNTLSGHTNLSSSLGQDEVMQLPEYTSEYLLPKTATQNISSPYMRRKILEIITLVNRIIIRFALSLFCIIPGTIGLVYSFLLLTISFFLVVPCVIHLVWFGWRMNKKQLIKFSQQYLPMSTSWYKDANTSDKKDSYQFHSGSDQNHGDKDQFQVNNDDIEVNTVGITEGTESDELNSPAANANKEHEEEFDIMGDLEKISVVPSSIFSFGRFFLKTEIWGIFIPIGFELFSWFAFFLAVFLRFAHIGFLQPSIAGFLSSPISWIIYGLLPFIAGFFYFLLATFVPVFDITKSLDLNDRMILYNNYGFFINNVGLQQYERNAATASHIFLKNVTNRSQGGTVFRTSDKQEENSSNPSFFIVSEWENCHDQNEKFKFIAFEQIKEIGLAVSLETVEQRAINMPWLCFTVSPLQHQQQQFDERRIILPIRLPHTTTRENHGHALIHHYLMSARSHIQSQSPLNDGLSVDETIQLLMKTIATKRQDLGDNIVRVVKSIKTIKAWGYYGSEDR